MNFLSWRLLAVVCFVVASLFILLLAISTPYLRENATYISKSMILTFVFGIADIPLFCLVGLRLWKMENWVAMRRDGWLGFWSGCLFAVAGTFVSTIDIPSLPLQFVYMIYTVVVESVLAGGLVCVVVGMCMYRCLERLYNGCKGFRTVPSETLHL